MKPDSPINEWNRFILDGNLDSLSVVYFHYYDQLFTYGMKHSSDKQSVEDAIQDVFMNLIKYRKKICEVKSLLGYLTSSYRRQLFLNIRNQTKIIHADFLPDEHFDFFNSDNHDSLNDENLEQFHLTIKQCIVKLPSKQQEIFFLRFESEISYEEIASMLQISVDSCYKSVYRSIKTIRDEVGKLTSKGGKFILLFLSGITKNSYN